MTVKGIEGLSDAEFAMELERGAKFVVYQYCISIVVMTFRRPSAINFVRSGQSAAARGAMYTLISLILGWWGIPWGPIYTTGSIFNNMKGGTDVTGEVLAAMQRREGQTMQPHFSQEW